VVGRLFDLISEFAPDLDGLLGGGEESPAAIERASPGATASDVHSDK